MNEQHRLIINNFGFPLLGAHQPVAHATAHQPGKVFPSSSTASRICAAVSKPVLCGMLVVRRGAISAGRLRARQR